MTQPTPRPVPPDTTKRSAPRPATTGPGPVRPPGAEPGPAQAAGAEPGGVELAGVELAGAEPGGIRPAGTIRASDAEREAAVEWLRIASVEGRLTFAELTERTGAAYAAVTRAELEKITADLPGMGAPGASPAPRQEQRRFTAVLGDVSERIVGRVEHQLEALSVLGDVVIDLRDAQVPSGEVAITATAVLGDVKIVVPDGVAVRLTGYAVMGDRQVRVRESPAGMTGPIVRVHAQAIMGDVRVVSEDQLNPLRKAFTSWWENRGGRSAGGNPD